MNCTAGAVKVELTMPSKVSSQATLLLTTCKIFFVELPESVR